MKTHEVNISEATFAEIENKRQTAVELYDTGYSVGDEVILHEYDEETMTDQGGELKITITGVTQTQSGNRLISFDPDAVQILT